MLDANLPTFFLKPASDNIKHHQTIYLSHHDSALEPAYSLHHADPSLDASRNVYSVALFDSYNPDVLFAEILLRPEWTQPTLSADEIRRNGGIPPRPHPILPTEFTIQLYNPDQQVHVKQIQGSWNASAYWEFEMPQQTFRTPSTSSLDKGRNDPTLAATTPKIVFRWRREGKLSKRDLVCVMCGKNTNLDGNKKKGGKDPDVTIALFQGLKEITIYEPNLYRVDMEDPKGLEVVLLLGAAAIRDIYFPNNVWDVFNIQTPNASGIPGRKGSSPPAVPAAVGATSFQPQYPLAANHNRQPSRSTSDPQRRHQSQPPPADPLTQWQIDAEAARLKKQQEAERQERERAEQAELKRIRKMLDAEEKEQRRKDAEIAKETERLRKIYGKEQQTMGQRPPISPLRIPAQRPHSGFASHNQPIRPPRQGGPYLQPPPHSASGFFGSGGLLKPDNGQRLNSGRDHRKSFLGLRDRSHSDSTTNKLSKKKSSMF
ncbi:hypothetical protein FGG08_004556 [Glutinoglossum americanum]|uniref:Uncharacterized protein n=1 Tax=Glutinoglossum americanum TaxID=1670608 RepID=A0A9P8IB74_9PEZI|nr:hypothetical protein FGG08_004556 [Glutinoglossum americanum]